MTQEDKELLLKDLCARLPYGVKAFDSSFGGVDVFNLIGYDGEEFDDDDGYWYSVEDCKPYLFPLSSMIMDQAQQWHKYANDRGGLAPSIDWLNAHHFDYRGLIEKGLAFDATGLNIY